MDPTDRARMREPLLHPRVFAPAQRPGHIIALVLVAAFVVELFAGGPGRWGFSAQALARGRYETLLTHMFAHAGVLHLLMNLGALSSFSAMVTPHLGFRLGGFGRYCALLFLSGFAGAAMFLAIHPAGSTPVVGISGAICGLWGAALRLPGWPGEPLAPLTSRRVLVGIRQFVISNAVIFAIIFALVLLSGGIGGLAWEAHLGGFLFGLLAIPLFRPAVPPLALADDRPPPF
jgi:membrane associated rhomboid family serine protease